jgi:hypothetical protein
LLLGTPITFGLKIVCDNFRYLRWIGVLLEDRRREPRGVVHSVIQQVVPRADAAGRTPH